LENPLDRGSDKGGKKKRETQPQGIANGGDRRKEKGRDEKLAHIEHSDGKKRSENRAIR